MKQPVFRYEEVKPGEYKISVVVDRERFSLPQTFKNVEVGKDEVAKKVLNRFLDAAKRQRTDKS